MEIFDYVGENFHIQGPNMHYHWNKKIDTWKLNEKENEDKQDWKPFQSPRQRVKMTLWEGTPIILWTLRATL